MTCSSKENVWKPFCFHLDFWECWPETTIWATVEPTERYKVTKMKTGASQPPASTGFQIGTTKHRQSPTGYSSWGKLDKPSKGTMQNSEITVGMVHYNWHKEIHFLLWKARGLRNFFKYLKWLTYTSNDMFIKYEFTYQKNCVMQRNSA